MAKFCTFHGDLRGSDSHLTGPLMVVYVLAASYTTKSKFMRDVLFLHSAVTEGDPKDHSADSAITVMRPWTSAWTQGGGAVQDWGGASTQVGKLQARQDIFRKWLELNPTPSWKNVVEALSGIGEQETAEQVRMEFYPPHLAESHDHVTFFSSARPAKTGNVYCVYMPAPATLTTTTTAKHFIFGYSLLISCNVLSLVMNPHALLIYLLWIQLLLSFSLLSKWSNGACSFQLEPGSS